MPDKFLRKCDFPIQKAQNATKFHIPHVDAAAFMTN